TGAIQEDSLTDNEFSQLQDELFNKVMTYSNYRLDLVASENFKDQLVNGDISIEGDNVIFGDEAVKLNPQIATQMKASLSQAKVALSILTPSGDLNNLDPYF